MGHDLESPQRVGPVEENSFPVVETDVGDCFVPGAAALGDAVIFRPAKEGSR